jgi:hypothetical protein
MQEQEWDNQSYAEPNYQDPSLAASYADQSVSYTDQSASQADQSVPYTDQSASQADQSVPYTNQSASHADQSATHTDQSTTPSQDIPPQQDPNLQDTAISGDAAIPTAASNQSSIVDLGDEPEESDSKTVKSINDALRSLFR